MSCGSFFCGFPFGFVLAGGVVDMRLPPSTDGDADAESSGDVLSGGYVSSPNPLSTSSSFMIISSSSPFFLAPDGVSMSTLLSSNNRAAGRTVTCDGELDDSGMVV